MGIVSIPLVSFTVAETTTRQEDAHECAVLSLLKSPYKISNYWRAQISKRYFSYCLSLVN